jgi:hypothetical protein
MARWRFSKDAWTFKSEDLQNARFRDLSLSRNGICFKGNSHALLLFSFLFFSLFPPFFLPYLRQLRLVPVIPGGAVDPFLPAEQKRIDKESYLAAASFPEAAMLL